MKFMGYINLKGIQERGKFFSTWRLLSNVVLVHNFLNLSILFSSDHCCFFSFLGSKLQIDIFFFSSIASCLTKLIIWLFHLTVSFGLVQIFIFCDLSNLMVNYYVFKIFYLVYLKVKEGETLWHSKLAAIWDAAISYGCWFVLQILNF